MRRLACLVILAVTVTCAGCEGVQKMLEGIDKPTASVAGVRLGELGLDRAQLLFDIDVKNPYAVPLPLANIEYGLASGSASFASGKAAMAGSIPAKGAKRVSLPVDVVFAELMKAVSGVRPGKVVPYEATMTLSVDAPGAGPLALPLSRRGEVPVPAVPSVAVRSVAFKTLSLDEASIVVDLDVTNPNEFAADLNKLGLTLALGGSQIASTSVAGPAKLSAGGSQSVSVPVSFKPANLGLAAFNMLRGRGATYDIRGDMNLGTPFGPLDMPYHNSGSTTFQR